ncbi:DegT/DnrJ/EryC1/StrS family aminotransferase [Labrys wisconsinensis]|nr:DegT/DnrJ/EryC1/StrS aminotransferase family protein [Labrys wisconsinensis]
MCTGWRIDRRRRGSPRSRPSPNRLTSIPRRLDCPEAPMLRSEDRRSGPSSPTGNAAPRTIPYFRPSIGDAEVEAVRQTLSSGWLTTGPRVQEFELAFARYVEVDHAVAVSSATAALHLALEALGVGPGDEVLVPTMTFASVAAVVIHLGARPVFVDCLPDSLDIDPADLERRLTPRAKVVVPMHHGGHPCRMDRILELARRHRLAVVDDAAHALPAQYGGRNIGTIGDATCFSFYANKTVTTGEGGMVATRDPDLAKRVRLMAHNGIDRSGTTQTGVRRSWRYDIKAPGYKANMTDLAASIGIRQLERCDAFRDARARWADAYTEGLRDLEAIRTPRPGADVRSSWHLYVIQLELDQLRVGRDAFIDLLEAKGVGSSVHFMPLHLHSYYRDTFGCQPEDLPNAARAYERILSLPIFPGLSREDVGYVVETIASIVRDHRR